MVMIPPETHPIWKRLITGEKSLRSSNVAINMFLFNSKLHYEKDPSPANVDELGMRAHELFLKFEKTLVPELQQLLD